MMRPHEKQITGVIVVFSDGTTETLTKSNEAAESMIRDTDMQEEHPEAESGTETESATGPKTMWDVISEVRT